MKKGKVICTIVIVMVLAALTACSSKTTTASENSSQENLLEGKTLFIYCGAGMTQPFTEIVENFQTETGAEVEVTYANSAQIISQIKASNEGDLFIAGDQGELTSIQDEYITDTKSLVKHIPVIAVQTGNPKEITSLRDLAKEDITLVLGDSEATPIGKIADKALTDAGILEQANISARTTTAPEIATAISLGECDAAIVWKENTSQDGIETVETTDMEKYIKTVPGASLKCSKNTEALEEFLIYLDSDTAKKIWEKYGYEILN